MLNRTLPFYLEDRTGQLSESDFDDMYDRVFLRLAPPQPAAAPQFSRSFSSSSASSALSYDSSASSPESAAAAAAPSDPRTVAIYNTGRRSSTREYLSGRRTSRSLPRPAVVLEFGRHGALGAVVFDLAGKGPERKVQMGQWLRKTGMFSGCVCRVRALVGLGLMARVAARSLSRKFVASDGHEYRWIRRPSDGTEWMVRRLLVLACTASS
ncbi:uncharacterized protein PHACADRAFT_248932 [Phanerochaete carnosa HHB-10118-sp]|uniref:Uncharacterized protein n=1 Tax=Phanerochaete carnosa (strain HHB-10118-sp) TaxID=650164 RepID=K5X7M7_PHACS|nr:uncharacterized protein PHACADRAFT_248932 [Phanerochaete carnosa HHB-10118-sp]EKM58837.1 hypothetical protein PHACADRAFT_248932 [Phanerochaete carnosa HHB-10118-sp]